MILHPLTGKFIVPEQSHKLQLRTILHDLRQLKPASFMNGIEAQYCLIPITLPRGTMIVGKIKVKKDAVQHLRSREDAGNMGLNDHAISILDGHRTRRRTYCTTASRSLRYRWISRVRS